MTRNRRSGHGDLSRLPPLAALLLLSLLSGIQASAEYVERKEESQAPSRMTPASGVIGEPEVRCGSEDISLSFKTDQSFTGRIFVKGHIGEPECVQLGDSLSDQHFSIRFDQCGVRRQREINGVTVIATVIVSFHPIFITKVDRAYRTACFYLETSKAVNQRIDVGHLTTELLESQTPLPSCKYEILADGPDGSPVTYARIGDWVYHKWTCDGGLPDVYCMRVHTCTVYDGQGGTPVSVLDENGCSADTSILDQLYYLADLSAGQTAQVFKFADRVGLYFNCQIRLTLKERQFGCISAQPQCLSSPQLQEQVEPSTRTSEIDRNTPLEEEHESGYPTRPLSTTETTTGPRLIVQPESSKDYSSTQGAPLEETPLTFSSSTAASENSITPTTPSGYKYDPDAPRAASTNGDYGPSVPVNTASSGQFEEEVQSSLYSTPSGPSRSPMPPGFKPYSASDLNGIDNSRLKTSSASSASMEDEEGSGVGVAALFTASPLHAQPEPYTRLIRRQRASAGANKTAEAARQPAAVADFDLPERGLIVLGIEESGDAQHLGDGNFSEGAGAPFAVCSSGMPPRVLALIVASLLLLATLTILLAFIVHRQRQLLTSPLL